MGDETNPPETPDQFLKALGQSLRAAEGVDIDLVDVLTAHILKDTPAQNAVPQAKDAILKLAAARANPAREDTANG